ncbi:GtrA family protein [Desulfosporosinus sp. PR]|uniref:GtrA family protein n=1 Tax=Candidatus Desulfosporosinus nitrosoreducens TaxID=3401928 RepID=UPI0027F70F4D|nr:GtrA family protein [Desulfosporosinus sp. PR]MDQ7095613.1 GtrA family protein [Desulfosporosinus sp. PR]
MVKLTVRQQEFFKFCLVGVFNTGIDFTLFALLFARGVPLLPAHTLAYGSGVINSFLLNRKWTFKESAPQPLGQLLRFVLLNLFSLAVTYELLVWFHYTWGWPLLASRALAVVASLAMNFGGSRLWVFCQPQSGSYDSNEPDKNT